MCKKKYETLSQFFFFCKSCNLQIITVRTNDLVFVFFYYYYCNTYFKSFAKLLILNHFFLFFYLLFCINFLNNLETMETSEIES